MAPLPNSVARPQYDGSEDESLRSINLFESKAPSTLSACPEESEANEKIHIKWDAVTIVSPLGSGFFGRVFLTKIEHKDLSEKSEYAVKVLSSAGTSLSPSTNKDEAYEIAKSDIIEESKMLWTLSHKNIIEIHALSEAFRSSSESSSSSRVDPYFLVLEVLSDTLDNRMSKWKMEQKKIKFTDLKNATKRKDRLFNRLESLRGVLDGLAYLHKLDIAHLDIKGANIGYDADGTAKIFDFGLAMQLTERPNQEVDGHIGTPRYMAPEIIRIESVDVSADVYSFAILLWEVCTLQTAYSKLKSQNLYDQVSVLHRRPDLSMITSNNGLNDLVRDCWDCVPENRPDAKSIQERLEGLFCEYKSSKLPDSPKMRGFLNTTKTSFRRHSGSRVTFNVTASTSASRSKVRSAPSKKHGQSNRILSLLEKCNASSPCIFEHEEISDLDISHEVPKPPEKSEPSLLDQGNSSLSRFDDEETMECCPRDCERKEEAEKTPNQHWRRKWKRSISARTLSWIERGNSSF